MDDIIKRIRDIDKRIRCIKSSLRRSNYSMDMLDDLHKEIKTKIYFKTLLYKWVDSL